MPRIAPFENHSDAYDQWFDRHPDLYAAELESLRQIVPPAPAEGLEAGVGRGRFAVPLGIGIGVEPSAKMASRARSRGIDVYSAVAERLPFRDGRFGLVLMVTTVCFLDDVSKALNEALRVLKRRGGIHRRWIH